MDLILNTFGTYLTKDNQTFVVVHKDGKQRIDPAKLNSISISKGAQISSDAVLLAIENEIDVFFIDGSGNPLGRVWSNRFGSVSTIRHNQLDFTFSKQAVEWIKEVICIKFDNQIALLYSFDLDDKPEIKRKLRTYTNRISDYKAKVQKIQSDVVADVAPSLRGWEGAASRNYFEAINLILPENYKFSTRTKRPATDVFNAMLNYGYGMLYAKVEGALIKAGIDPYIGIMHREDYARPVLVFDFIEKYRVWIEYVVVNLCIQEVIDEDCYSVRDDGAHWLEGLGKRIVAQAVNDYLDEVILLNGIKRSRKSHIALDAQSLAQKFLDFKPARP